MSAAELTRNQSLVLDALAHADGPQTAYALLERLRDAGLRAPPQVYRALEKLQTLGLVHRLESANAFVACAHPHTARHGVGCFAICEGCGQAIEFSDDAIERRLRAWSREHGFEPSRSMIEMRGRCARCMREAAAQSSVRR